jgi:hypothetical protein
VYQGEVVERVQRPDQQWRRRHQLEVRVVAVQTSGRWVDLAVVTRLQRQEEAERLRGGWLRWEEGEENLPLMQLVWVRLWSDGEVRQLLPAGPPPWRWNAAMVQRPLAPLPVDSFAANETGMFVPPPVPGEQHWVRQPAGQPRQWWERLGCEAIRGERCWVVQCRQEGEGMSAAEVWRRQDTWWVSSHDGIVRRVARRIERSSSPRSLPWAWVTTEYELSTLVTLGGRRWERLRRDLEVAYSALRDAQELGPQAAQLGSRPFEQRLSRVEACLLECDGADPYRPLLAAAQRALEAASRGLKLWSGPPAVRRSGGRWPQVGETMPSMCIGSRPLQSWRGHVVLLVFFAGAGETTELTLAIAQALHQRYGTRAAILPLAAWGGLDAAQQLLRRHGWNVTLYEGTAAAAECAVTTAPRFLLVDRNGVVQWSFTGVGPEIGYLVRQQLERCLAWPTSPNSPTGNSSAAVTPTSESTAETP